MKTLEDRAFEKKFGTILRDVTEIARDQFRDFAGEAHMRISINDIEEGVMLTVSDGLLKKMRENYSDYLAEKLAE